MSGVYPSSVKYFFKEISGYSRQKYKLSCNISQGQTLAAGDTLVVPLPANSVVDLDTLVWWFKGYCNGNGVAFSRHIETIIQSISVEVNGQIVDTVREFGTLWRRLADYTMGADKATSRDVLQVGGVDALATMSNISTWSGSSAAKQFAIHNWGAGFLATAQPRCISTSILGDVRIHITLASTNVLTCSDYGAGVTTPSYNLTDNYFTVDCLSFDPLYYDLLNKRLAEEGVIEIPFQTWSFFSQGTTSLDQTSTHTISTGSLDMLIGTYKDSNLNLKTHDTDLLAAPYFKTGSSNLASSSFSINNVSFPPFTQEPANAFVATTQTLGVANDVTTGCDPKINSLTNYTNKFFMHAIRLNHPSSSDERYRCGLNLKGTNAAVSFSTVAKSGRNEAGITPMLYAGMTSVLEVKPFKVINVLK